jgi:hypothetical protein
MRQGRRLPAGLIAAALGLSACGRSDPQPAPPAPELASEGPALTAAALDRTWVPLEAPHPANARPHVVRGPHGFVAMSRELTGGKLVLPTNNYLYRSDDGITWHRLPLPEAPEYFGLRGLAHGAGRYVMVGHWGNESQLWSSTDLVTWDKQATGFDWPLWRVRRVNQRFFVLSVLRDFLTSEDGVSWSRVPSLTVQQQDVAYGNGVFVMVGSGPVLRSRDGRSFDSHSLDCTLPDACIQDPNGGIHQRSHSSVVFAPEGSGGRFHVHQLSSADGARWEPHPTPTPTAFARGYLFSVLGGVGGEPVKSVHAWRPGESPRNIVLDPPPAFAPLAGGASAPALWSAPLPGGETCLSHRCVLVDSEIFLIR